MPSPSTKTPDVTPVPQPPVPKKHPTPAPEVEQGSAFVQRAVNAGGGASPQAPPGQFGAVLRQMGRGEAGQRGVLRRLQGGYGNQYVGRVIQAKLTVEQPGDKYEHEAEQASEAVMRMSSSSMQENALEMTTTRINLSSESQFSEPELPIYLSLGSGEKLPESERHFFETRFGRDFRQVRVHHSEQAAETASTIGASAYTSGRDIAFAKGKYQPGTPQGRKLLAHELTHVLQQESWNVLTRSFQRHPGDDDEPEESASPGSERGVTITQTSEQIDRELIGRIDPLSAQQRERLDRIVSGVPLYELIKERDQNIAEIERIDRILSTYGVRSGPPIAQRLTVSSHIVSHRPLQVPSSRESISQSEHNVEVTSGMQRNIIVVPSLSSHREQSESTAPTSRGALLQQLASLLPIGLLSSRVRGETSERSRSPGRPIPSPLALFGRVFSIPRLRNQRNQLRERTLRLTTEIENELILFGISDTQTLVQMVEIEFPTTWINRAEQIAIAELNYNRERVREEQHRYPGDTCTYNIHELREADRHLHELSSELARVMMQPATEQQLENPASFPPEHPRRRLAHRLRQERLRLGREFPIILLPNYHPGVFLRRTEEDIARMTGSWTEDVLNNIEETEQNIEEGRIRPWHLSPHIEELTYLSLNIPRESILGTAVQNHIQGLESEESLLEIGRAAAEIFIILLTAAIFAPALPIVAGVIGAADLWRQVERYQIEEAAEQVALEPERADISTSEPAAWAIALAIAGLFLDVGDLALLGNRVWRALGRLADTPWHRALLTRPRRALRRLSEEPGRLRTSFRELLESPAAREIPELRGVNVNEELTDLQRRLNPPGGVASLDPHEIDRIARRLTELESILHRHASIMLAHELGVPQEVVQPFLRVYPYRRIERVMRAQRLRDLPTEDRELRRALRTIVSMNEVERNVFSNAVGEFVSVRPDATSSIADFITAAARHNNPNAALSGASRLLSRNISRESLRALSRRVLSSRNVRSGLSFEDVEWLGRIEFNDEVLDFLARDPQTPWRLMRRYADPSQSLTGPQMRTLNRRLRGAAGEWVFWRNDNFDFLPELRQVDYSVSGRSGDFTVQGLSPTDRPRIVEVKSTTSETWSRDLLEWRGAGGRLSQIEESNTIRRLIPQLRDAASESGERPILVITDALDRQSQQQIRDILSHHGVRADVRTIPESEIVSTARGWRLALRGAR